MGTTLIRCFIFHNIAQFSGVFFTIAMSEVLEKMSISQQNGLDLYQDYAIQIFVFDSMYIDVYLVIKFQVIKNRFVPPWVMLV